MFGMKNTGMLHGPRDDCGVTSTCSHGKKKFISPFRYEIFIRITIRVNGLYSYLDNILLIINMLIFINLNIINLLFMLVMSIRI